jgi:hypothetical protein
MFNFNNTTEEVNNNAGGSLYIRPGIHEVTIKEIYHQPVGPDVKDPSKNSTIEKGVFVLVDNAGAAHNYDVLNPTANTYGTLEENTEKVMKKLMHFLSKTATSADIETLKGKIQQIKADNLKDLIAILSKAFTGKKVRIKFTARDGKYTQVPGFLNGWAECIDVTPTKLRFDEAKDGLVKKDDSKVESTGSPKELDWLA